MYLYIFVYIYTCTYTCLYIHNCIYSYLNTYYILRKNELTCSYVNPVCCSVLQCVAVCCSVLQCVAVCCSQFKNTPTHILPLFRQTATHYNTLN